jgi:hypothetical protein
MWKMTNPLDSLHNIFDGWNGYQQSIVHAVTPLTPEQLRWRPKENFNSVGELVRHISLGRLTWLLRMDAPGAPQRLSSYRSGCMMATAIVTWSNRRLPSPSNPQSWCAG